MGKNCWHQPPNGSANLSVTDSGHRQTRPMNSPFKKMSLQVVTLMTFSPNGAIVAQKTILTIRDKRDKVLFALIVLSRYIQKVCFMTDMFFCLL
jgi:hypothetical protein